MKKAIKKIGAYGVLAVAVVVIPFGAIAEGIIQASIKAFDDYAQIFAMAKEVWRK